MTEYIERDEAIAALTEFCYDQTASKYLSVDDCMVARGAIERATKVLESLPATDVEPVQQWISAKERLPQEAETFIKGDCIGCPILYECDPYGDCKPQILNWLKQPFEGE